MEAKFVILLALAAVVAILLLYGRYGPYAPVPDYQIEGGAFSVTGVSSPGLRHRVTRKFFVQGNLSPAVRQNLAQTSQHQAPKLKAAVRKALKKAAPKVLQEAESAVERAVERASQFALKLVEGYLPELPQVVGTAAGAASGTFELWAAAALAYTVVKSGLNFLDDVVDKLGINPNIDRFRNVQVTSQSHIQTERFYKEYAKVLGVTDEKIPEAIHLLATNVSKATIVALSVKSGGQEVDPMLFEVNRAVLMSSEPATTDDSIPPGANRKDYVRENWIMFGALPPEDYKTPLGSFKKPTTIPIMTVEELEPYYKVIGDALNAKTLSIKQLQLFAYTALKTFNHGKELELTDDMVKYYDEIDTMNEIEQKLQAVEKSIDTSGLKPTCRWTKIELKQKIKRARELLAQKSQNINRARDNATKQPRRRFIPVIESDDALTNTGRGVKGIAASPDSVSDCKSRIVNGFLQVQDKDKKWTNVRFYVGDSQVDVKSVQQNELECAADSSSLYVEWVRGSPCDNTENNLTPDGKYIKTSAGNCELPFEGLMTLKTLVDYLKKRTVEPKDSFCKRFVSQINAITGDKLKWTKKERRVPHGWVAYSAEFPVSASEQKTLLESINSFKPQDSDNPYRYIIIKGRIIEVGWKEEFENDCKNMSIDRGQSMATCSRSGDVIAQIEKIKNKTKYKWTFSPVPNKPGWTGYVVYIDSYTPKLDAATKSDILTSVSTLNDATNPNTRVIVNNNKDFMTIRVQWNKAFENACYAARQQWISSGAGI